MKLSTKLITVFICFQLGIFGSASAAETYIDLDFETDNTGLNPVGKKGYPLWSLHGDFDKNFGTGNSFEISNSTSHSGNNSLRFIYEGRNGICNTCGSRILTHKAGVDGVDYFVAGSGEDLTLEQETVLDNKGNLITKQLPHASPGKLVYNRSRGFSQWQVVSVGSDTAKNDKLALKLLRPGIGNFANQPSIFNGKDSVSIARQCGVDGIVGKSGGTFDLTRRSDCNNAIVWFRQVFDNRLAADKKQRSGESIFRRVYLKAELTAPPSGNKLNYMNMRGNQTVSIVIAANKDNLEVHLSGLKVAGGKGLYAPGINGMPQDITMKRGTWYYIEQQYKAETYTMTSHVDANGTVIVDTYNGDGNGEYRLWFAKSGEETDTPALTITGLSLPPMLGGNADHMSLFGNEGHHLHTRGSWYMDDIKISDTLIGFNDVARDGNNKAPPNSPQTSK